MINRAVMARMKPGVLLLNVARGGIIDEQDLADALRDGDGRGRRDRRVLRPSRPPRQPAARRRPTRCSRRTSAPPRRRRRSRSPRRSPSRSSRCSTAGPPGTRSTRRCSRPETAQAIAPYLPLAETLGPVRRPSWRRHAPRTLTLEIAGEPAAYDASSLVAAVLRGLLETTTEERVNLVNAGTLAKARGITVVERKTPNAGAFSSLLTLTAEADGQTVTLAGTVANGEPRLVRLQEHAMDLAPAGVMLISHHRDRPGTVGRVGALLGRGRRQHQLDDARPLRAARRRLHGPRARRRRARRPSSTALAGRGGDDRHLGRPPGRRAMSGGPSADRPAADAPLIPEGLDATLVLLRHGESEWIVEGRFQGQARRRCPRRGRRQAALAGRGSRARTTPEPCPSRGPAARDRPLAARPDRARRPRRRGRDRAEAGATRRRRPRRPDGRPTGARACSRSGRASGRACTRTRSRGAGRTSCAGWRRRPWEVWAPGGESPAQVQARVRPALAGVLERLGRDYPRGTARPAAGPRLRRASARTRTSRGRSSWATTACSRSRC